MERVLILGGGIMQLPALRTAREEGVTVLLADANADCPGRPLCDEFLHVDLADCAGMEEAARVKGVTAVFTAGTDFSTTVAWVAERLGLPGLPYRVALRASDKALMRRALRQAGVPVPDYEIYEAGRRTAEDGNVGYPCVVKPVDNMGARGVRVVEAEDDLGPALEAATASSRSGRAIRESLIPGREYSIDALVVEGRVVPCGVADRHIRFAPYFIEMGHTIPTALSGDAYAKLVDTFVRGVEALGIRNGAAKGDVFVRPGAGGAEAWVGEIAARLSGGYMSGWTTPYAYGTNPTREALRIARGLRPHLPNEPRRELGSPRRVCAERAIISIPGTVERLETVSAGAEAESELFTHVGPGSTVHLPTNNVEKCANVIVTAATRREAVRAARRGVRQTRIVLRAGDEATLAFLFTDGPRPAGVGTEVTSKEALECTATPFLKAAVMRISHERWDELIRSAPPVPVGEPLGKALRTETHRDWTGRSLADVVGELERDELITRENRTFDGSGTLSVSVHEVELLSSLLMRAIARGGLQGGRFLIDTVTDALCSHALLDWISSLATDTPTRHAGLRR